MNLSEYDSGASWIGRVNRNGIGPCVVTLRDGKLFDITSSKAPTVRDILERDDVVSYVQKASGTPLGGLETWGKDWEFLAPCDFQAIKACGVTFARSMIERVIEERSFGDPKKAALVRERIASRLGQGIQNILPGTPAAEKAKQALIEEGLWSQYLEVGIGPYAEVFSKAQVLSSVGYAADIGINPISNWNNPEPEIVLAINSKGKIIGATLGNDVNLRDIEGRSALLLSKAKDNKASCAIGPFIRLFDTTFTLDHVRKTVVKLKISGPDGYELEGVSSMSELSRDPEDLVSQTYGRHHQYPDGFILFLGTLFAPTKDRDVEGQGFTHKIGDSVEISCPELGTLVNTVKLSTECSEWTFGASALARNLARRNLI